MRDREKRILEKLTRRLKSTRGTAYFEFAVFVPVLLLTFLFAADFTRVLYAEQQVEIATRVLCDIESHLRPGDRDKGKKAGSGCPGSIGKKVVREYLSVALAKEGIYAYNGRTVDSVYCRGSYYTQEGILHSIVNDVLGLILGQKQIDNKFFAFLAKVLGGITKVMTLGTQSYILDVIATDKVVRTSVSVMIQPFSPCSPYTIFGQHDPDGVMLVPSVTPRLEGGIASYNRPLSKDKRVRYYCYMPSLDTIPLAPYTFIRQLTKVFKKWVK